MSSWSFCWVPPLNRKSDPHLLKFTSLAEFGGFYRYFNMLGLKMGSKDSQGVLKSSQIRGPYSLALSPLKITGNPDLGAILPGVFGCFFLSGRSRAFERALPPPFCLKVIPKFRFITLGPPSVHQTEDPPLFSSILILKFLFHEKPGIP